MVNKYLRVCVVWLLLLLVLGQPFSYAASEGIEQKKQYLYDDASLLTVEQHEALVESLQATSTKHETDVIIITSTSGADTEYMTEEFYDNNGPGFEGEFGSTAILYIDSNIRSVYMAGFGTAERTLNSERLDRINEQIIPYLGENNYYEAMRQFVKLADQYMGTIPEVVPPSSGGNLPNIAPDGHPSPAPSDKLPPDHILFNGWFQLGISMIIGLIVVSILGYRFDNKLKVTYRTYEDRSTSQVIASEDRYLHSTVTKRKIERNDNSSGGGFKGGGGGMTRGGHSHSGSKGSF